MRTKIYLFNRKKILMLVVIIFALTLFLFAFNKMSNNTLNVFDPIYKGNAEKKQIAFACNVVWGNEQIPDILRILEENNIKISFFIGGDWASKYPEVLTEIYSKGHELGNHGYMHRKQSQLNEERNKSEILKAEQAIQSVTGVKTTLFAPPYGDINDLVVTTAEQLGYKLIMWSVDTIDWNTKDYNRILQRLEKKHHNGAIVLMHPKEVTVEALPHMIENLNKHGYSITTVSEVLE